MAKQASTRKIAVTLGLPRRVADLIVRAQAVHDTMAANTKSLPSPSPALPVLQASIDALTAKEAAAKTRVAGAVDDRNAAEKVLRVDLNNERAYVESVVNADPTNAAQLAGDAGMTLRAPNVRSKAPLTVKAGKVSGEVHLVAKATKGATANDWQYSTDGGKTWLPLPSTSQAETTLTGLSPATTIAVRHRALTRSGYADWTDAVTHVVA